MLFQHASRKNDQIAQEQVLVNEFSGPLLFDYVWWILTQAQKRQITTLYFLARDGYLLREIACKICEEYGFPIDCRYFYCSRASLRMPSYYFIGDEALDLLLIGGYNVTLNSLMQRAELTEEQCDAVQKECQLFEFERNATLSKKDFDLIVSRLRQSQRFRQFVVEKSKSHYANAIGYMRQEGMLDRKVVAIVDSGWTGTMQRSLRQLLASAGFNGEIVGFYYGMYATPKDTDDGTYLTWMFSARGGIRTKVLFNNNLFECLLSAPHGMTVRYEYRDGRYMPRLLSDSNEEQKAIIDRQIDMVMQYTKHRLKTFCFSMFNEKKIQNENIKRIRRYMAYPTCQEVDIYGRFLFCDDITEGYHLRLAGEEQIETLKGYSLIVRIFRKILKLNIGKTHVELFWPYGTIAYVPRWWKRTWYRWNVFGWELVRYVLQRK